MKNLLLVVLTIILSSTIFAGDHHEKPASQFAGEYNFAIESLEKKVVSLAEAIPQEKMSWTPSEDVRSIAQCYLHMAQSVKYLIATIGDEAPAEFSANPKTFESSTTKKEEIVKYLKDSFKYYKAACIKLDDKKLNEKVNFFGNEVRIMVVLNSMMSHAHEHLGQSIAYARMVGVTPPWSKKEN